MCLQGGQEDGRGGQGGKIVGRGILTGLGVLTRSTGCSISYSSDNAIHSGGPKVLNGAIKN